MSSNLQKPAPMLQKRFLEDLALTGLTLEKKTVEQNWRVETAIALQ